MLCNTTCITGRHVNHVTVSIFIVFPKNPNSKTIKHKNALHIGDFVVSWFFQSLHRSLRKKPPFSLIKPLKLTILISGYGFHA